MNDVLWEALLEINLHSNYLPSIDLLNQFRNLRKINASHNYIVEVNLNLQRLEHLELSNNYILRFPILNLLPKLKTIDLNSNKIQELKFDFSSQNQQNLEVIDLGYNQIGYKST